VRYAFIRDSALAYPLAVQCRVLRVSLSGYYAWRNRTLCARRREDARLLERIRDVHVRSRATYGPRRIRDELRASGETVGAHRIARIRRDAGIWCVQRRRFKATTDSGHRLPVAPNLLPPIISIREPGRVWVGDITYIQTDEGWLYLSAIADLYTRELVGWAMDSRMGRDLPIRALRMAWWRKKPAPGLLHYSDRGCQYASYDYQAVLKNFGMRASMSGRGNCYDNAAAESFFATLKKELVHLRRFATREEAKRAIFEYIEVFYNRIRRHSRLGNLAPAEFERRHYANQMVA
jgi:putative transposase